MRDELSIDSNILLYRRRIVVLKSLQQETLQKIHAGHQGIQKCCLYVQTSVWWPGLSTQINQIVKNFHQCFKEFVVKNELLISSKLPYYPWQNIGSDLFSLDDNTYMQVVDYFSRWPEIVKLSSLTTKVVLEALKSILSRYGVPQILMSDNGPQYSSCKFAIFTKQYDFSHLTSSPHFHKVMVRQKGQYKQ